MLKPVHALVGSDLFLQLEALARITEQAPANAQRITLDGENAQLSDVLDELRSFAMFSSCKLVVVRSAEALITRFRESMEEYVSKPTEGSTLVLRMNSLPKNQRIYKLIAANGQLHDCEAPKDLAKWVLERGRQAHKLKLGADAAAVLADVVGADLGKLDNELAKLALQTEGEVDAEAIARTVAFQREQEMWDMTNELAAGNVKGAMERWRQLIATDSSTEFRAVTWLVMWLEKVRKALVLKRLGRNEFAISKELKIWPASAAGPFLKTAAAIGDAGVARLIDLLADVDHRSKTGLGDMAENVERFLLSVKL